MNQAAFDRVERQWVAQRMMEGCPKGAFDLAHLRAIHRHLFQDIFDWAGEIRTVELSKNGEDFQALAYIHSGMANVHARLIAKQLLTGLDRPAFADEAEKIIGDVNYVRPFREGNGRTQIQYLRQLANQAGHPLDLAELSDDWVAASQASHQGDYSLMARSILAATEAWL